MKKLILLSALFLALNLHAQNNVLKFTDGKIILPNQQINLKPDAKNSKAVQQFTDNDYEDVEVYAAVNPTDSNNIIVSWMWLDPSGHSSPVLIFRMYNTFDGGLTWNQIDDTQFLPHNITTTHVVTGGGDPVIVFDKNGRAHFTWLYAMLRYYNLDSLYVELILHYAYSDDGGTTWIRPQNDTIAWGSFRYIWGQGISSIDSMYPPDKEWATINRTNNDLIVSSTEFWNLDSLQKLWGVRIKPANADTFSQRILVPPDTFLVCTHGSLTADDLGNIYAFYPFYPDTARPIERLAVQKSEDGGYTWNDPVFIADANVENFTAAGQVNNTNTKAYERLTTNFYAAADTVAASPYHGRLYAVWNANDTNYFSNVNIYFSYSDDQGQTWSQPIRVNSDPLDDYKFHHRPTITVAPDGKVIIAWYDTRNAQPPYVYNTDYYIAISNDGGQTFREIKISDTLFNYNEINSGFGVGEYNQITATKNRIFIFWGALDQSKHDVEIYFATYPPLPTGLQYRPINNYDVQLSPNPFHNTINLRINAPGSSKANIKIFSINGKLLFSKKLKFHSKTEQNLNLSFLHNGAYNVLIEIKGKIFAYKIIKN